MLLGGVAVTHVVGVGLDDVGIGEVLLQQGLHPLARDDVGAVLLAGVELDAHAAGNVAADLLVGQDEAFGREVAGEIYGGVFAAALVVGEVLAPVRSRLALLLGLRSSAGGEGAQEDQ